jgi:G:T-mismatch repair DNA endonuclease (very short patch repair protein)
MPSVAWPATRTGIAFSGEAVPADWDVTRIEGSELRTLNQLLSQLALLNVTHRLRASADTATRRISKDEQMMLEALLRKALPDPDRNFEVRDDDGKFRGVADFAWEKVRDVFVRVALEVDGWHWHAGIDLANEFASWASTDQEVAKTIQKELRSRGARDQSKRRILMKRGWAVITVHDTEIRAGKIEDIAEDIRVTIAKRYLQESGQVLPPIDRAPSRTFH